jgi:RimJ/RimL family protein N-acetyltransferase
MIQTLNTPRLTLRALCREDREALVRLHRDPAVMRFNPSPPASDAEALARLDGNVFCDWPPGLGFWAIEREATFQGWIMLIPFRGDPTLVEVGYRLHTHAWGQGVATEALAAVTAYATLGRDCILAEARSDNPASIRVLEKAGYRLKEGFEEDGVNWDRYMYGTGY